MKFRFSLRALLALVAVLAAFGYWRSRPAVIAREFELAVANKDYTSADAMIVDANDQFLSGWARRLGEVAIELKFKRQTPGDWLCGRSRGEFSATTTVISRVGKLEATSAGVRLYAQRESSTICISLPTVF